MKLNFLDTTGLQIVWVVFFLGCAHGPAGYQNEKVKGIKIIKNSQGQELRDYEKSTIEDNFPKAQDGTKTVIDFLLKAKESGAAFVSDIEINIASDKTNCRTMLIPEEEIKSKPVTKTTGGRYESKSVLKPVTRFVSENEYRCQSVSKPVQRLETYYEYQYDYSSKSNRSVPKTRYVTKYESQNECSYVPVSKTVTRYEYQYESQYIPPKTEYLTQHYSEWKLGESPPDCQSQSGQNTVSENRIRGTAYKVLKK